MANTWHAGVTPVTIAQEALMILENNLVWGNLVYRDYQSEFGGKKQGQTITIRGPASFTANEFTHGGNVTVQDVTETNVQLTLEKHFDVTVAIGAKERTLDLESFSAQVLQPAMAAIAQGIDAYIAGKALELYLHYGTAGTPISSLEHLANINKILHDYKCPKAGRIGIVDQTTEAKLMQQTHFVSASVRGDPAVEALRDAAMGRVMGIDWYMNQNVYDHTAGTWAGESPLIDNAAGYAAGTTTIHIDAAGVGGAGGGTILEGDIFTIAGTTGYYRNTADVTVSADAQEEGDLVIEPGLEQAVVDDAAITEIGDHARNVVMHPNCMALAVVPLELPAGAASAEYINSRGMGIRLVSDYSATTKVDTMSFDVLVGAKVIDPRLGIIVLG
jgi:hypothetical protein